MLADYVPSLYIKDGSENVGSVALSTELGAVPLRAFTKIELILSNDNVISSDVYPTVFDWNQDPGVLYLYLGSVTSLLENGTNNAKLFLYDGLNINGAWGGDIRIFR